MMLTYSGLVSTKEDAPSANEALTTKTNSRTILLSAQLDINDIALTEVDAHTTKKSLHELTETSSAPQKETALLTLDQIEMVSGFGQFHTNEPDANNPSKKLTQYTRINWQQIISIIEAPPSVPKEKGQWFIPSTLATRSFKAQEEHGKYWVLAFDFDENKLPLNEVSDAVCAAIGKNVSLAAYNSRSATQELLKCRVLVPLAVGVPYETYKAALMILNDLLDKRGLNTDRAMERAGQLVYLPNKGAYYDHIVCNDRELFDPEVMMSDLLAQYFSGLEAKRQAAHVERNVQHAQSLQKRQTLTINKYGNPIDAFNDTYTVEEMLNKAGYDFDGVSNYRHPHSQSGSFSASVKNSRVYSLSTNDPLYTVNDSSGAHDAFSAFCELFHGGDQNAAIRDAADNYLFIGDEPWNVFSRREHTKKTKVNTDGHITKGKTLYEQFIRIIESNNDEVDLVTRVAAEIAACSEMSASMVKMLFKKIVTRTGTSLASLEKDANLFNNMQASKDNNHLVAAKEVVKSFGDGNIIACISGIWQWHHSGVWKFLNDREIKTRIHSVAGSCELTSSIVNSILDLVKTETFIPDHQFNTSSTNTISVKNGVLELVEGVWRLKKHCREDFRTYLIPVAYDPYADATRFKQFLHEIFDGTADQQDRIRVIKQGFGYTLLDSCHLERFFILIGSGANGKSVLLSTLAELVGRDQVTAVQPKQFENRFQRAHLEGKLANIITEIAEGGEIADAQLKGLVSGELTTAEHKFESPRDFRPIATHWFGTNHLPHTRDFSDALFRRAILIEFPRKFAEHERDPNLSKKLLKEMSGILNFALEGLTELLVTNQFTVPHSSKDLAIDWRGEADQANQFVEECCEVDASAFVEMGLIYDRYREWTKAAGIQRPLNKLSLSKRLVKLGFIRERNKSSRNIRGIKINQVNF